MDVDFKASVQEVRFFSLSMFVGETGALAVVVYAVMYLLAKHRNYKFYSRFVSKSIYNSILQKNIKITQQHER